MPELEITDEQASFLDALRDAIEDELVGPYGTVRRRDALQYLIDNYGEPDELLADGSAADVAPEESEVEDDAEEADDESGAEASDADDEADDAGNTGGGGGGGGLPTPGAGGDGMLDEMMALMEEHDDKWSETDSAETAYEVELPDGDTETVQTQDDVRALLFKNYR